MRKILGVVVAVAALFGAGAGVANAATPPVHHPHHINLHGRDLFLDQSVLFYPGFGVVGSDVAVGNGTAACQQATAAVTAERQLLVLQQLINQRGRGRGGFNGYRNALSQRSRLLFARGPLFGQANLHLAQLVQEQTTACA